MSQRENPAMHPAFNAPKKKGKASDVMDVDTAPLHDAPTSPGHESVETTQANNGPDLSRTRVSLTLDVKSSKPREDVRRLLQEFLEYGQRSDKYLSFLPWYASDLSKPKLAAASLLPTNFMDLQTYSPRLAPKKDKSHQKVYCSLYLEHSDSLVDLQKDLHVWFDDGGHKLFEQAMQCEKQDEIGIFCWSTKRMDTDALAEAIKLDTGIECALRWKVIYTGIKGDVPEAEKV